VASSRADPAQHNVPRLNIASTNITFFINNLVSVTSAPHLLLASNEIVGSLVPSYRSRSG
jgi:hypothetical protein